MEYITYLIDWIKHEVKKAGAEGVILGISGGIDSAVVAKLAKKAFPNNSIGLIMPIISMKDKADAINVANVVEIDYKIFDLTKPFDCIVKEAQINKPLSISNIKPRLRMTTLYAYAQMNNYLVLGTDNKAEIMLGYFTKYGDGGCDLMPLANLRKEQVYELAKFLSLPKNIVKKTPSAGLWEGQTDEGELGFLYKDIDAYLRGEEINIETKNKIEKLVKKTEHKRKIPAKPHQTM